MTIEHCRELVGDDCSWLSDEQIDALLQAMQPLSDVLIAEYRKPLEYGIEFEFLTGGEPFIEDDDEYFDDTPSDEFAPILVEGTEEGSSSI